MKHFTTPVLLIFLFLFSVPAYSQARLEGYVEDKSSGLPLPGANVILQGTTYGASTNLQGRYVIMNVPPGVYTMRVTYIGYHTQEIEIQITTEREFYQYVELEYGAVIEGEAVIVTAQARGQMEAINQQLASQAITNIVASDRIQEVPDANAAESVGRIPGVSIRRSSGEGDQVVIRGLTPRLNLITINGIRMPSLSEHNTAVGLAGISQYMLDGIEVRKSLTAADDADVVGGIVDLKLATAPEGLRFNTIFESMYSELTDNYGSYRAMLQASNRFFNNALGVIFQVNMEKADRTRERYQANYGRDERVTVTEGVFLTGGAFQHHEIIRDRFSANLLLDYRLRSGKIQLSSIYTTFDEDSWHRNLNYNVVGGAGLDRVHHSNRSQSSTLVTGLNVETMLFDALFFDFGASFTRGFRESPANNTVQFNYDLRRESPIDPGFIQNTAGKTGYDVIPAFRDLGLNYILHGLSRNDAAFEENESTVQSNLKIPLSPARLLSGFVQFGGKARFKDRDYDYNQEGGYLYGGATPVRLAILRENPHYDWPDIEGFLIPAYPLYDGWSRRILEDRLNLSHFAHRRDVDQIINSLEAVNWDNYRFFLEKSQSVYNDYRGDESLYAAYLMTEWNWRDIFTLNTGVRYEHEETRYSGHGAIDVASYIDILDTLDTSTRTNSFVLPSASLRIKFLSWADLRMAYSKSLARPDYYSFIPRYHADLRISVNSPAGNPGLKPALSENFDLILSFYNNVIGLFTVGGFRKEISDFYYQRRFRILDVAEDNIHGYEKLTVPRGEYLNLWFNNPEKAVVEGIEFDWQTTFWYLPRPLNGLVLNLNYAMMRSETSYYVSRIEREQWGTRPWEFTESRVDSFLTRRMIDQPNTTFNMSLGYDYRGFSMRVAYYFQGNTLVGVGEREQDDTFSQDYGRWDFSMRQRLPVEGLSIQLLLNNITSTSDEQYRWTRRFNTFEEYYGRTGSIGLRYVF